MRHSQLWTEFKTITLEKHSRLVAVSRAIMSMGKAAKPVIGKIREEKSFCEEKVVSQLANLQHKPQEDVCKGKHKQYFHNPRDLYGSLGKGVLIKPAQNKIKGNKGK